MDYLAAILNTAAAPGRFVWRRLGLEPDLEDYESTTTRPPEFRTEGPTLVRRIGVVIPHESDANIVVSMPAHQVSENTDPEHFRYIVANAAAEAYDELRRLLREREE